MTRITCIIPYMEDKRRFERLAATIPFPEDVCFTAIHPLQPAKIKNLSSYQFESDIVIARGLTFRTLMQNNKEAQAIEIAVTGYDIMNAVQKAIKRFNAKTIALVFSHIVYVDIQFIEETFHVRMDSFQVSRKEDAVTAYHTIKSSGKYDAIISGFTVNRLAAKDNFNAVIIEAGDEAIKNAINEALAAIYARRVEKRKNGLISAVVESMEAGVVAVDQNQCIVIMNGICRKMLNIGEEKIQGKPIGNYIDNITVRDDFKKAGENDSLIRKINNKMVVIKRVPINVEGIKEGTVLTLQYVDRLQKVEIDIRQKLSRKGLVAKYYFDDIVGKSSCLRKAVDYSKKYARTDYDILIIGKTGTGKELFAQSIHNYSSRREQPFVAINCATISENLLESELFGYAEGAFTGAIKGGKSGLFELAHKGTLFMDEIGELPIALQAKLLRVLQEKEIRKLGDDKIIPVDVRIIAASNVSLRKKVEKGEFREDLLFRLNILSLNLPPLRIRKEDILDLIEKFTNIHSKENRDHRKFRMDRDAVDELMKHDWQGNVRELKNICDRLYVLNSTGVVTRQDVIDALYTDYEYFNQTNNAGEGILSNNKLTREETAQLLRISRTTLWRRMKKSMVSL